MKLLSKKELELDDQIRVLAEQREEVRANRTICCPSCNKRTQLKKATIIDDYFYVRPSGCTGGDYWSFNEYKFYCAKCDTFNRSYVGSWNKKKWDGGDKISNMTEESLKSPNVQLYFFIKEYHRYFGEQLTCYDDSGTIVDLRRINKERKERKNNYAY